MCSFVAISGTYIYSTLIGAAGAVERMNRTFIIAFVLNIALNIVLIPSYKALGAAYSTFITQFFVLFSLVYLSKKLVPSTHEKNGLQWSLTIVGFAVAVFTIGFLMKSFPLTPFWYINMAVAVVLSVVLAWIMGFLNHKKIEVLLKT
jgi:peptidoglycan biosynthesis protein MviN/MurJ (putative lipid II flippase)